MENDGKSGIGEPMSSPVNPPPTASYAQPIICPVMGMERPKKKWGFFRIMWGIIRGIFTAISVLVIFSIIIGIAAVFSGGRRDFLLEEVIQKGPETSKIVVINVEGLIDGKKSKSVCRQIKKAGDDATIKAVILRVNSPGGMISSSDQIHNEIMKFRKDKGKNAVAFMEGLAASGGYYISVGCEQIVAEPTVITGSIGVIMEYFVVQQLLEQKLGINPIVLKGGARKDWPNPFTMPTDEQKQYLDERIIQPAHQRFKKIVAEGRPLLKVEDVNRLADGSIYNADEAKKEGLIDEVGYMERAIELTMGLANLTDAKVVEYRKPSFAEYFEGIESKFGFDRNKLYELGIPQLLYLWDK